MDLEDAAHPLQQRRCEEDVISGVVVENAGLGDCVFLALAVAFQAGGLFPATAKDARA